MAYHILPTNDLKRYERAATGIKARNGDEIYCGDIVQTIQDTVFKVAYVDGQYWLERPEGLYDFEPYMSPNIWIIGNVHDNPELAEW